jgi:1-phosphofructokinase family hexose kinase
VIVAAGLTPAWQQIYVLDQLRAGEVNRAGQAAACASGKVLNVGIALAHLGAEHRLLSPVGGPWQAAMHQDLAKLGVNCGWVPVDAATRVCTTILDRHSGATTELVENAAPLSASELDEYGHSFVKAASASKLVVLSGSLPAGTPADYYRRLLERTEAAAIVDARGEELLATLDRRPLLVKPNREELGRTLGHPLADDGETWAAMEELVARGAQWVLVTAGPRPAWLCGTGGRWRIVPPQVEVVNPIGCGDCLAAGVAAGLAAGQSMLEALRLGFACATDNARQVLPARLDPGRVARLASEVRIDAV